MAEPRYGLFFDMPEEEYRAIPALNYSGMKWLRVSPLDFWMRSPLNPNLAEVLAEEGPTSEALTLGLAFDTRIISGRGEFERLYAGEFEPVGPCLKTLDDLKGECRRLGLKVSGSKAELTQSLLDAGAERTQFYDLMEQDYEASHPGKTFLTSKWVAKIETAAAMIEKDPTLCKAFSGGAPQVTVIWRDEIIGVDCKARLDYVKPAAIVDLKTFQNSRDLPIVQAVEREIVSRRYYVQAQFYIEAMGQAAKFLREGLTDALDVRNGDSLIQGLRANHPKHFLFVFQVKGIAPIALGRSFSPDMIENSAIMASARSHIEAMKQVYRDCMEHYGPDVPWVAPTAVEPFQEDNVPQWMYQD